MTDFIDGRDEVSYELSLGLIPTHGSVTVEGSQGVSQQHQFDPALDAGPRADVVVPQTELVLGCLEEGFNGPAAFEVLADAGRVEIQVGAGQALSVPRASHPGKAQGKRQSPEEIDLTAFELFQGGSKLGEAILFDRAHDLKAPPGGGADEGVAKVSAVHQHDDLAGEGRVEGFQQGDGQLDLGLEGSAKAEAAVEVQLPIPGAFDVACDQVAEDEAMAPDHFAQGGAEMAAQVGQLFAPLGYNGIVEDEVQDGFSSPFSAVAVDDGLSEPILTVTTQRLQRPRVLTEEAGQCTDAVTMGQVRQGLMGLGQQQPQHQGRKQRPTVAGKLRFEREQVGHGNLLEVLTSLKRMP